MTTYELVYDDAAREYLQKCIASRDPFEIIQLKVDGKLVNSLLCHVSLFIKSVPCSHKLLSYSAIKPDSVLQEGKLPK